MVTKLILTLTLLLGGQACMLAESAGDGLPAVFRTWLAARQTAPDLRVEFSLTKTLPTLKEPVKATGRFWKFADGRFRWETGRPAASALVFDGVALQSWEVAENQWRKLNPGNHSMRLWMDLLGGQNLTSEGLTKDFLITAAAVKPPLASVILEPKSKRERKAVPQIELKFNTAEQRLVQLLVRQGDGGSQTMDFGEPTRMTAADRAVVLPAAPK
ncbi:MAG: outer membrane lipoprotein carrier protein LolA [Verrucomicrobia bacterium]|nr:outer membrane lipoprotein carrier protein LolA [Verrucomicrobiota bacterium]